MRKNDTSQNYSSQVMINLQGWSTWMLGRSTQVFCAIYPIFRYSGIFPWFLATLHIVLDNTENIFKNQPRFKVHPVSGKMLRHPILTGTTTIILSIGSSAPKAVGTGASYWLDKRPCVPVYSSNSARNWPSLRLVRDVTQQLDKQYWLPTFYLPSVIQYKKHTKNL